MPEEDHQEIASEGWARPEPFVVRKIHARLIDVKGGPVVPEPHRLAWRNLTDERIVLIFRDPRDISVSLAFYMRISLNESIQRLHDGVKCRNWQDHVKRWLNAEFEYVRTSYERLSEDAVAEATRILREGDLPVNGKRIVAVVERQSFDNRKAHIHKQGDKYWRGKDFNLRFMRKGIIGDWRNHYRRAHGKIMEEYFGDAMRLLGYTRDSLWWEELPK